MDMAETTFTFASGAGSQLSGHLEPPEGTPRGWAIFAHCFTCGKDSRAAVHISRALSRAGIGVLRFDFAGTGISGGPGEPVSFASDVEDLRAAAQAMTAAGMSPSLLVGHSLGGMAAIVAAADLPDIAAVATIGAPADLQHILRLFRPDDLDTIASEGEASVEIAGRPFLIRRSLLQAIEGIDVEKAIATLRRPVLVMHSPLDQVVGKGFPLERASTTVQHEKVAVMMPSDRFTRTIVLDGPLSDDQRARILEIADRCPVDLSLIRGSDVQTELSSTSQAADTTRLA
ncbi:alpha/beta hydrolase [Mesorhizobium sp. A556]